jgi:hypothetical protein
MFLYRVILFGIIAFTLLILADSFILPQVKEQEIYKTSSFIKGLTNRNHPYIVEFLVMESGHRYLLPKRGTVPLKANDTVIVGLTGLFKRPASIQWRKDDADHNTDLRIYSVNALLLAGPVASLLFPFLMLLTPSRLGNRQRWLWLIISIAIAGMNVWLYWW